MKDQWQRIMTLDRWLRERRQRFWYYDGAPAPLAATVVSESDRFALLLSLQSIDQYRGTPIYEKLQQIYRRLLDLIPAEQRSIAFARLSQSTS